MERVEDAVRVVPDERNCRGANYREAGDSCEAELDVDIFGSFSEDAHLDKEVEIEGSMAGEKDYEDIAENPMVGVELLMREFGEVLNGVVLWFRGEKVVEGQLGHCDYTEAFRKVHVIWWEEALDHLRCPSIAEMVEFTQQIVQVSIPISVHWADT